MGAELLTKSEVAKLLHCSVRYVGKLIRERDFPAIKIGKTYLIPANELDKWIHENTKAHK